MNNNISNEKKWEELHIHLQDLLAGYVDDELEHQEKRLVEAHLAGCETCRADVAHQQLISQRLSKLPLERLSPEVHQQIDHTLSDALVTSEDGKQQDKTTSVFIHWFQRILYPGFITASGWSIALVLLMVLLFPSLMPSNSHNVPMVADVIAEYSHLDKTSLPVSDSQPNAPLPANWPNAHLLTSWNTTVGGEPAKAFAMRDGDKIIVQYRINEAVFFRDPNVRQAVADKGRYVSQQNNIQVLAIPLKDAGLLVVGPTDLMPPAETISLVKT